MAHNKSACSVSYLARHSCHVSPPSEFSRYVSLQYGTDYSTIFLGTVCDLSRILEMLEMQDPPGATTEMRETQRPGERGARRRQTGARQAGGSAARRCGVFSARFLNVPGDLGKLMHCVMISGV